METITFEQLPQAIITLYSKLEKIERLLTANENKTSIDRWLNLNELCEYLPEKPVKATVYGWVHNSLIPYHKKSKKLFFLQSEIDSWLKVGRKKTNAEIATAANNYIKAKAK